MVVQYFEPFSRAWKRMINSLFNPFDIGKWFVFGFSAFLAGLIDGPHGNIVNDLDGKDYFKDFRDIYELPTIVWEWLSSHPLYFSLIIVGLFLLMGFIILITWLSSRGEFMFLHNVVLDKAEIAKPWSKYRKQGNSLFLWRLLFGLFCFLSFAASLGIFFVFSFDIFYGDYSFSIAWLPILIAILSALMFFAITAYISMFVDNFVVPLMYKYKVGIIKGWGLFLPLLFKKFGYFLLFGILLLFIYLLIVFVIIFISVFTCCIGFLVLIIPYVNSVVLLPISFSLRAFSLEFLEQFGEEFKIFPENLNVAEKN